MQSQELNVYEQISTLFSDLSSAKNMFMQDVLSEPQGISKARYALRKLLRGLFVEESDYALIVDRKDQIKAVRLDKVDPYERKAFINCISKEAFNGIHKHTVYMDASLLF